MTALLILGFVLLLIASVNAWFVERRRNKQK
jgi:hypothetical protein